MLEFIKSVLSDLFCFSIIEGVIYAMWYHLICGCNKFKWYQVLIMSVGNCLISQIFSPIVYQALMILWMGLYLWLINNKEKKYYKYVKFGFVAMMFTLICEMIFAMIYEKFLLIDFSLISKFLSFLYLISIRIIEVLILYIIYKKGDKIMKSWFGSIEKRK